MLISNFLGGGAPLQGGAGPAAISAGDLVQINQLGELYSVKVSDNAAVANAGGLPVASTTFSSYPTGASATYCKGAYYDKLTGSIFVTSCASAANTGIKVTKYSSAGAVAASLTVDTASGSNYNLIIDKLSNGNYVIIWDNTGGANIYFAVLDQYLNLVVAKTLVSSSKVGTNSAIDGMALSGGGFAVVYPTSANGLTLNIYSNTGGVVFGAAGVSGGPAGTTLTAVKMAQISNGNLALLVTLGAGNPLGHAIVTAAGASVLAYTQISATAGFTATTGNNVGMVSAVSGGYAVTAFNGTLTNAFVFNNAGVQQGATIVPSTYGGVVPSSNYGQQGVDVVSDGTNFIFAFSAQGATSPALFIFATPAGVTTPTVAGYSFYVSSARSVLYENGYVIVTSGNGVLLLAHKITASGTVIQVSSATAAIGSTAMFLATDATVLLFAAATPSFAVEKYLSAAIVGVSQQTVAAGNAGTSVTFAHGGGSGRNGYPVNAIAGSVGKGFNHSATNVVGNTGTMLGAAVALEGII